MMNRDAGERNGVSKLYLAAALFLVAILYSLFATRNYYWDGIAFSLRIEEALGGRAPYGTLLHPNHLLYEVLGAGVLRLTRLVDPAADALSVLQIINELLSIACAALLFRICLALTRSLVISFYSFFLFALGALWWKFSTDADPYILASVLLLCSFHWLLKEKPCTLSVAASFHVTAMLFHQLAVCFYAVPLIFILLLQTSASLTKRLWTAMSYVAVTASLTATGYYMAYHYAARAETSCSFVKWLTSHSEDAQFTAKIQHLIGANIGSYIKLVLGGKLSLLADYLSATTIIAILLIALGLSTAIYLWLHPSSRSGKVVSGLNSRPAVSERNCRVLLYSWIVPYVIFLSVWLPWNGFYKLLIWPALVLLQASLVSGTSWIRSRAGAVCAVVLASSSWNFAAYIYPHSHETADPVVAIAKRLNREMPKNSRVFYTDYSVDDWYLRYFTRDREWRKLPVTSNMSTIPGSLFPSGPSNTCFETSALSSLAGQIETWAANAQFIPKGTWRVASAKHFIEVKCFQAK